MMLTASLFQKNLLKLGTYSVLLATLLPDHALAHGKKAHQIQASETAPRSVGSNEPADADESADSAGNAMQSAPEVMVSGSVKLDPAVREALETVAHNYLLDIKSVFKQACFNCHTSMTEYPWYYSVPGITQLIDNDVAEGRDHLDFSNDYPFISHGELTDDLKSIGTAIRNDTMPPMSYKIMHWSDGITEEQKQKVLQWVDHSLSLLLNAGYVASAD